MPRERNDRDVQPFEFRVGAGAGPALGGMHRRGSPSEVPPHKFWTAINARVRPEGLVSRDGLVEDLDTGSAKPIDGMAVPPDEDAGMGEKLIGLTMHLSPFFRAGETDGSDVRTVDWKLASLCVYGDVGGPYFMTNYMRDAVYRPMIQNTYREAHPNGDVFYNAVPPQAQRPGPYSPHVDWTIYGGLTRPWAGPRPLDWVAPNADGVYTGGHQRTQGLWGLGNMLHYRGLLTHVGWRFFPKGATVPTSDPWTVTGWELCLGLCELRSPETLDKSGSANWAKLATPDLVGDTSGTGLMDVCVRRYRIGDDRMNEILTLAVKQDDGTLKVFDWDGTTFTDTGVTVAAGSGTINGVATAALGRVGETGLFLICQYLAPQTNAAVAYYQEEPGAAWTSVTLPANFVCYGIVGAAHEGVYFDYGTIGDWQYVPDSGHSTYRCSYLQHKLGFWKPSLGSVSLVRNWWTANTAKMLPLTTQRAVWDGSYAGPVTAERIGSKPYYGFNYTSCEPMTAHGIFFWKNKLYIWVSPSYPLGYSDFEGHMGDLNAYIDAWRLQVDDLPAHLDSYDGSAYVEYVPLGYGYPYRLYTWIWNPGLGQWVVDTVGYGMADVLGTGIERIVEVEAGVFQRTFEWLGVVGAGVGFQLMAPLVYSPLFDGSGAMSWWLDGPGNGTMLAFGEPGFVLGYELPLYGPAIGLLDPASGTWGEFWRNPEPGIGGGGVTTSWNGGVTYLNENIFPHGPAEELAGELLEGFDHPGL